MTVPPSDPRRPAPVPLHRALGVTDDELDGHPRSPRPRPE